MRLPLAELRLVAKTRADGYLQECLDAGVVVDGVLIMPDAEYRRLRKRYSGLGDAVAIAIQPFVKLIDYALDRNLQDCAGCRERKKELNQLTSPH